MATGTAELERKAKDYGLADADSVFMEGFSSGIQPVPDINVWQYADKYRQIAGEAAAEPGQYRTDRTPYCREIMEALSPDSEAQVIVVMKATQLGLTEVANNWAFHTIELNPGPFAFYFPTETDAATHSKMKFTPSVEETETVKAKLVGDNTILSKMFLGTPMKFMSAETARNYRHMTWKFIDAEEIDEWPVDVGGQGDPTELLINRMDTMLQQGGKIYMPCSPTIYGLSKVEHWFENSDQRYFYVPCPICGEYQRLIWNNLRYKRDEDYNLVEEPKYLCAHCNKLFDDGRKEEMLAAGQWIAHHPEKFENVPPGGLKIAGFGGLSSLYSPPGWVTWALMAQEWIRAHKENDPNKQKRFINTRLGETWKHDTDVRNPSELMKRREKYPAQVPMGACVLTLGVDIQKDRIEVTVIGWGAGFESWIIEHKVFPGDTNRDEVWNDLWSYRYDARFKHESGLMLPIAGACIDSSAFTDRVYAMIRPHQGRRNFAVKGKGRDRPPITGPNKVFKRTINLYTPGTDTIKERIFAWLKTKKPEGWKSGEPVRGYCHFPLECGETYFDQLTGEVAVVDKGLWVFRPRRPGQAVEALDCFVYAYAALKILDVDLDRMSKKLMRKIEATKDPEYKEKKAKKRDKRMKKKPFATRGL